MDARTNSVRVACDLRVYPLDVVYGAAYVFLARCYVRIDRDGARCVRATLTGKEAMDPKALPALAGEFWNELVDQFVRARLARQHTKLREMIVGRALFAAQGIGADPTSEPTPEADYLADPLGIAVPWEEKFLGKRAPGKQSAASAPGSPPEDVSLSGAPPTAETGAEPSGTKK